LVQNHVCLGNLIGRKAYFQVEADRHYCNLYANLVGETSKGRKGTSFGHTRRLFTALEELWVRDCIVSGLSSGEGLIWRVRDPIMTREKDKKSGQVREVLSDPGIPDKRLLVLEPEFASILKQIDRRGNTLSPILRQGWDGGVLQSLTTGREKSPVRATDAH